MAETAGNGYVYFATYIRLMEETEYAFLRSRSLCVVLHDNRGTIGFPRISCNVTVHEPAVFDQTVRTKLELVHSDGKQIEYTFEITTDDQPVASGIFIVACCRFPDDEPPFAILTPEHVLEALGVNASGWSD